MVSEKQGCKRGAIIGEEEKYGQVGLVNFYGGVLFRGGYMPGVQWGKEGDHHTLSYPVDDLDVDCGFRADL